jgi:hypothetical protein
MFQGAGMFGPFCSVDDRHEPQLHCKPFKCAACASATGLPCTVHAPCRYDKMSARELFRQWGVSQRMYEEVRCIANLTDSPDLQQGTHSISVCRACDWQVMAVHARSYMFDVSVLLRLIRVHAAPTSCGLTVCMAVMPCCHCAVPAPNPPSGSVRPTRRHQVRRLQPAMFPLLSLRTSHHVQHPSEGL